jgi:hypothetical protein
MADFESLPWTVSTELHPTRDVAEHGITGYRIRDAAGIILAESFARPYPVKPRSEYLRAMAAAPAMLAALKALRHNIVFDDEGEQTRAEFDAMLSTADDAISQAEGVA